MAANTSLQPVSGKGWQSGLGNLLRKELGLWFGTHRWWKQSLLWLLILNGIILLMNLELRAEANTPPEAPFTLAMEIFFKMSSIAVMVGAVLSAQGAIVGERQSGTAAWILSKPVARPAFVLSKFAAHAAGMAVLAVLLQAGVLVLQTRYWSGRFPDWLPFLGAVGLILLSVLFYQALSLMLGTFFRGRGAVAGTALGFLFAGTFVPNLVSWSVKVTPWLFGDFAAAVAQQQKPLPTWWPLPVAVTAAMTVLCLGIAVWRFGREEL